MDKFFLKIQSFVAGIAQLRPGALQEFRLRAVMNFVAPHTFPLRKRSMQKGLGFLGFLLVMAEITELRRGLAQINPTQQAMGFMALPAVLGGDRLVNHASKQLLDQLRMTIKTMFSLPFLAALLGNAGR
jgi:hypothetical protein